MSYEIGIEQRGEKGDAGDVAARVAEACDEAVPHRIVHGIRHLGKPSPNDTRPSPTSTRGLSSTRACAPTH